MTPTPTPKPADVDSPAPKLGAERFEPIREIRVRGAREHNLRSVDIDIPRDRLVVVTGLSGSGKSSLAFDTIFAEGQRKYMESLSSYARQFLDQLRKPDVDSIEGLPPTIAIEQRQASQNPRSTVATSTEIYDYLRLLFARTGQPTCWHAADDGTRCGLPIHAADSSRIARAATEMEEGTRLMVLAPLVRGRKGFHRDVLERMAKGGFVRARVDGAIVSIDEALGKVGENPLELGRHNAHDIEAIVDRVVVRTDSRQRLADSVQTALTWGEGVAILSVQSSDGAWADTVYSEHFACVKHPDCALEELEPRLFSFNAPAGACPSCHGLGALVKLDPDLVMPDHSLGLERGAVAPLAKAGPTSAFGSRLLAGFAKRYGLSTKVAVGHWTEAQRQVLLYGHGAAELEPVKAGKGSDWQGVIPLLEGWFEKTDSDNVREHLAQYMSDADCPECHGERLHVRSLSVWLSVSAEVPPAIADARARLGLTTERRRLNIADFTHLGIHDALRLIDSVQLSEEHAFIAAPIVREVRARLGFLASVGLDYLSLDRKTATLSGGEAQRIRLATQVGSGIVGAAYVLDEPSIGLHSRDNDRLIRTLRHLTDIGNTVVVVEHDEEMIRAADHVVDMGPGPGVHGGMVVAQGSVDDVIAAPESLTGQYLSRVLEVPLPAARRQPDPKRMVVIRGAAENNLKGIDVRLPLGLLVCVTGVSGSGKSTLVNDILLRAARRSLYDSRDKPGAHAEIQGLEQVERIIEVDQTPIGRTPRSNPATYTGIFDEIRKLFCGTPDARAKGYGPGRFSFNVKGGRCEGCQGQGTKKVEMHFLPDVFVECEVCEGKRYNPETLSVTYRGRTIADVLAMTTEEASEFFVNHRKIASLSRCLVEVGLGYIELGQPSTTLSGGEAQRVKLATELGKPRGGRAALQHTLFVLDEPTTGLHFEDVRKLTAVIDRFVERGDSVVIIEHNLDVVKRADWIIDLGPEGGEGGGRVIAEGTPEDVAAAPGSSTGAYLAPLLERGKLRVQRPSGGKAQPKKKASKRANA